MQKLLERLLKMRHRPALYLGRVSLMAVSDFVHGYESAVEDVGRPHDGLRGFDEWVNLRMLLPPCPSVRWSSRISSAAGTTHQHAYPHAEDIDQRACLLFFDWLAEFATDCEAQGVDAIIAEHDRFTWPEVIEVCDETEDP